MSGGRARRRKQKAWKRSQAGAKITTHPCPKCGNLEPHFVPPSFGDAGFYACTLVAGATDL